MATSTFAPEPWDCPQSKKRDHELSLVLAHQEKDMSPPTVYVYCGYTNPLVNESAFGSTVTDWLYIIFHPLTTSV